MNNRLLERRVEREKEKGENCYSDENKFMAETKV